MLRGDLASLGGGSFTEFVSLRPSFCQNNDLLEHKLFKMSGRKRIFRVKAVRGLSTGAGVSLRPAVEKVASDLVDAVAGNQDSVDMRCD